MNKSGQHLAANLLQIAKQLVDRRGNKRFKLTFRWSAGHLGIAGNEDADKQAKAAADGESSEKADLPPCLRKKLGYSLSAIRQARNEKLKIEWAVAWTKSPRSQHLKFKDLLTPSSQKYLKYISSDDIPRKIASTIFQLRVGHVPLNRYLHRFKITDSAQCPACGHLKEKPEHYLLHCPKYVHERWPIHTLAGGRLPNLEKLLSSPKLLKPLANYIQATGRFEINLENNPSE